jgi:hypothetical protein
VHKGKENVAPRVRMKGLSCKGQKGAGAALIGVRQVSVVVASNPFCRFWEESSITGRKCLLDCLFNH